MDTLHISALRATTRIGVHAWEQRIDQTLLLDITIPIDCSDCEDALSNTLDYDSLCRQITTLIESNSFNLIETVATQVAGFIKTTFQVEHVTVCVSKPHAVKNAGNITVSVSR